MKEKWGFTNGWERDSSLDEPRLVHDKNASYPQTVGFRDLENNPRTISLFMAVALGLIGLGEVKSWNMSWKKYAEWKHNGQA